MLEGLYLGITAAFTFFNLVMVISGCIIGTVIGMLPGLGPMSIIAIMIPIAISIGDPASALILLAGVYYGAIFGGSTSSILINAPGVAGTVATSFDGYPLARAGKAGKALTIAAISSFIGGTFGAILLFGFAPFLSKVALSFHSSEYFALMVLGLSAIAAFAGKGQVAKALMMAILGIMLATVGETALFNAPRFTAGIMNFQSGVGFITLAMAMFALPEAIYLILDPLRSKTKSGSKINNLRITLKEAKIIFPVITRQSFQGFFIGVLPGAGATIASFLSYAVERNLASTEEQKEFGKGSIKGLAAPETANNAACTGSFVPLLTLGIPGSGTTAILLGALIALNVQPGPRLMVDNPEIFWGVIISMYLGNIVLLILNLPLIPYIARILAVPKNYLIPLILFFSVTGIYVMSFNNFDIYLMIGIAVVATFLRLYDFPMPPLILAFVLGGLMEENLRRSLLLSNGSWEFLWDRTLTLCILLTTILIVVWHFYKSIIRK